MVEAFLTSRSRRVSTRSFASVLYFHVPATTENPRSSSHQTSNRYRRWWHREAGWGGETKDKRLKATRGWDLPAWSFSLDFSASEHHIHNCLIQIFPASFLRIFSYSPAAYVSTIWRGYKLYIIHNTYNLFQTYRIDNHSQFYIYQESTFCEIRILTRLTRISEIEYVKIL